MRDGRKAQFTVVQVGVSEITGGGASYPLGEIASIERRSFSWGKTAGLVGGVLSGALVFLYYLGQASLAGNIG